MADANATLRFYYPWPAYGIKMSRQWPNVRENFDNLAPLVRAAYVDLQPASAHNPGENDLAGWAIGERDFRNKFRIFYSKTEDMFKIQYNNGTEDTPAWNDAIQIRESDLRVTVTGSGGIAAPTGGFYTDIPRQLAITQNFPLSSEWQFTHNLNTVPLIWDTFRSNNISVVPYKVDVGDPNTAYFYFASPVAGKAIAVGGQARGNGINFTDGTNIYYNKLQLNVNSDDFYFSRNLQGNPVLNLQQIDITQFDTTSLVHTDGSQPFIADQSMAGFKLTNVGTPVSAGDAVNKSYADALKLDVELTSGGHAFTDISKLVFDSQSFYFDTTASGGPVLGLRGSLGGGSSGNTAFSASFGSSSEWQLTHSLNTSDLVWSVYDDQGMAIIPSKVAVHDPNTAYFYFGTNSVAGRAVVTAAGGATSIDTSPFIRKDGTVVFTADESMGGFKLTNVGTPTANTDAANKVYVDNAAGNPFYYVTFKDNVHTIRSKSLNFNQNQFYLSQTAQSEPMLNLRYSKDYLPAFVEAPLVQNIALDPCAPYAYTIEAVDFDNKSGSCIMGFYIVSAANRNKNGVSITGLDPLSVSTTLKTAAATGANSVSKGDAVYLSIFSNTSSKHLRVTVTAKKP